MTVQVVTSPTEEPVDAAAAQEHLGVTGDSALLEALIVASRQAIEGYLDRALVTQTLRLQLDHFPRSTWWYPKSIQLPRPKLQSVGSVKYFDLDDVEQTLSASEYVVVTTTEPGEIQLKHARSWPSAVRLRNAVEIEYTAGYGLAVDVPDAIKRAILLEVAALYERRIPGVRSETIDNASVTYERASQFESAQPVSPIAAKLLAPFRVYAT